MPELWQPVAVRGELLPAAGLHFGTAPDPPAGADRGDAPDRGRRRPRPQRDARHADQPGAPAAARRRGDPPARDRRRRRARGPAPEPGRAAGQPLRPRRDALHRPGLVHPRGDGAAASRSSRPTTSATPATPEAQRPSSTRSWRPWSCRSSPPTSSSARFTSTGAARRGRPARDRDRRRASASTPRSRSEPPGCSKTRSAPAPSSRRFFDAVEDGDLRLRRQRRLLRHEPAGRQELPALFGRAPTSLRSFRELARRPTRTVRRSTSCRRDRAWPGPRVGRVELVHGADGRCFRLLVRAAPVATRTARSGRSSILWRDITELYDGIAEHARLEGAVKTARRVDPRAEQPARAGGRLRRAADGTCWPRAATSRPAGREDAPRRGPGRPNGQPAGPIIRFEESEFGGQVMLDLDRATTPSN